MSSLLENVKVVSSPESICVYFKESNALASAEVVFMSEGDYGFGDLFKIYTSKPRVLFNRIFVPKNLRGRGIGSVILDTLLTQARSRGITVFCTISPYGDMTYAELKSWYLRKGFTVLTVLEEFGDLLVYNQ